MQVNELTRLTNRHLAKLLDQLDEIQSPLIIKDAVKKHMWLFSHDIKDQILNEQVNEKEQVNEVNGR